MRRPQSSRAELNGMLCKSDRPSCSDIGLFGFESRLSAVVLVLLAREPTIWFCRSAFGFSVGAVAWISGHTLSSMGATQDDSHALDPLSFACVLTTMPLEGLATAVRVAGVLRLGIS